MRTLDEMLSGAARVRVTTVGAPGDDLLDLTDPAELELLREALAVGRATGGYCMCLGDLTFTFLDGGDRRIVDVGFHHGVALRWPGCDGDAPLLDGGRVLRWLARHGVDGPLAQEGQRQAVRQRERLAEEHWKAAAPAAVRDLLDLAIAAAHTTGVLPPSVPALVATRLAEAVPDRAERAAALLTWYGSGTGRYSGFPVHESLPAPALAATPIADLIDALQRFPGDVRVAAGAVRHLCGWRSRTHLTRDIARLPAEVRARLLAVARESDDDTTRRRAEQYLATRP
ncbi:hypothetical protein AB0G04_10920 [Actinoplanes sp. NPDC023801]|uniref:hypothetical protein n=1 Tax=Actinoplanes sp. NPDC023801 TaxID=3154595 RepID=UPI0033D26FF3